MNWILFGFKSCGKTTFGKQLARELGRDFLDTDDLFEISPREYVLKHSEERFREREAEIIQNLHCKNSVIAVGGGAILPSQNLRSLQSLGSLIYLACPKEILKKRVLTSPLPTFINDEEDFEKIYCKRIAIYETIPATKIKVNEDTLWHLINLVRSSASQPGVNPTAKR